MADIEITPSESKTVNYRKTIAPAYMSASWATQNTNSNWIRAAANGKSKLSVAVNNLANQSAWMTIYGMNAIDSAVDADDVFSVAAEAEVATKLLTVVTDKPYPFYLIKIQHKVAPTDTPAEYVKAYIYLS